MNPLRVVQMLFSGWIPFGPRHCILCGNDVWNFLPYLGGTRAAPPLMRELAIVGSDIDNFSCPRCRAHDRERHLLMYLEATGLLAEFRGKSIAHFAPEKRLSPRIESSKPAHYIRCDLHPTSSKIQRVDMLAMAFPSGTFDFLIANHVLEHVADDQKALSEILRVLKPGGHAILQTPYSGKLHATWEDAGIADDSARLQAYGQADHVRLYGRDIFSRFVSAGFESRVRTHADVLSDVDTKRHGVNPLEPFFLFRKPDARAT